MWRQPPRLSSERSEATFGSFSSYHLKRHLLRFALFLTLPLAEQSGVILHNVLLVPHAEFFCSLVNPARRAFDFTKVANGSFINNDLSFAIGSLGAKLLVAKRWSVAERPQNCIHPLAVIHAGFQFLAAAVASRLFAGFMRQLPF